MRKKWILYIFSGAISAPIKGIIAPMVNSSKNDANAEKKTNFFIWICRFVSIIRYRDFRQSSSESVMGLPFASLTINSPRLHYYLVQVLIIQSSALTISQINNSLLTVVLCSHGKTFFYELFCMPQNHICIRPHLDYKKVCSIKVCFYIGNIFIVIKC